MAWEGTVETFFLVLSLGLKRGHTAIKLLSVLQKENIHGTREEETSYPIQFERKSYIRRQTLFHELSPRACTIILKKILR